MAAILKRKKEIKDDIQLLESGFEKRFSGISKGLKDTAKVKKYIVKHPFISVAAATGLGFLTGALRRKKRGGKHSSGYSESPGSGLTSLVLGELKQIAARKAVHYISDLVDRQVSSYQKKSDQEP